MAHVQRRVTKAKVQTLKNDLIANLTNSHDFVDISEAIKDQELFQALDLWLDTEDYNDSKVDE